MNYITGLGIKSLKDEDESKEQYCFSTELSKDTCMMGVFVGYKGDHLKSFLVENFPKEAKSVAKNFQRNDDVAKMLLKTFENMDKKVKILLDKPVNNLNDKLECATGMVIVLKNDIIHVANLGCNRAFLLSDSATLNPPSIITQLTQEHCLSNPEEFSRISSLGIEVNKTQDLCGVPFSRCFGGTALARHFNCAAGKYPWTAEPSISGPFKLQSNVRLLVVVSMSVLEKLGVGTGWEGANEEVAAMIEHQLSLQECMNSVARSVLEEVAFFSNDSNAAQKIRKFSKDLSHSKLLLLVHNFRNAFHSPVQSHHNTDALSIDVNCPEDPVLQQLRNSNSSHQMVKEKDLNKSTARAPENSDVRIKAYVDFLNFHETIKNVPESLREDYEVIMSFMNT